MVVHAVEMLVQMVPMKSASICQIDTDVLVLAIKRSQELCDNTSFVTGRGSNNRSINIKPIAEVLGPSKTATLPAFHAVTGADITGRFSGKGKLTCWKAFEEADESVPTALVNIVSNPEPPSSEGYRWTMDTEEWVPVMTLQPPAPQAVIQLVKCGCTKERCSSNRFYNTFSMYSRS